MFQVSTPYRPRWQGLDVHLVGLGPSLRRNWTYGDFVVGVNEACTLPFVIDGFIWDHGSLQRTMRLIKQDYGQEWWKYGPRLYIERNAYLNCGDAELKQHAHYWDQREVKKMGLRVGTGTVALIALASAGVRRITLHGFDTFWLLAERAGGPTRIHTLPAAELSEYDRASDTSSILEAPRGQQDPPQRYGTIAGNMSEIAAAHGMELVQA